MVPLPIVCADIGVNQATVEGLEIENTGIEGQRPTIAGDQRHGGMTVDLIPEGNTKRVVDSCHRRCDRLAFAAVEENAIIRIGGLRCTLYTCQRTLSAGAGGVG